RVASSTGGGPPAAGPAPRRAGGGPAPLAGVTVLAYRAGMGATLRGPSASSQKGFCAGLLGGLTAAGEGLYTGRTAGGARVGAAWAPGVAGAGGGRGDGMGGRGREGDVASLRAHRARLDAIVTACEAGDGPAAVRMINALLAETGAIPQVVAHDGRGPHIHV